MVATALLTAEELARLPDDGHHKYELVKGVLVAMVPPGFGHGDTASTIARHAGNAVERLSLGGRVVVETGFMLQRDPDTVRGPDVAYVSAERLPSRDRWSAYFEGAPDLAVEIVSPNDTAADVLEKVQEYLAAGTRLVWVVETRTRTVTVYRPDGSAQVVPESEMLSGEDVLPGFTLAVRDLFA